MNNAPQTDTVGLMIYDEVEVLDFCGPFEVFSVASRLAGRDAPKAASPFEVMLVADKGASVRARGGLMVTPHYSLEDHPRIDIMIVPGGIVTAELGKPHVIEWIKKVSHEAIISASVCTGSFLLARAGLLDGLEATTHWEDLDDFRDSFPRVIVQKDVGWVDHGDIVTSAGISAGIDMSLHLVRRRLGIEMAERTARQMEYRWRSEA